MKSLTIDILLVLTVVPAWLGCLAFVRFSAVFDRLHCVAFVNLTSGVAITLAAFVADGPSSRALKTLVLLFILLVTGAATVHAAGRALLIRGERAP